MRYTVLHRRTGQELGRFLSGNPDGWEFVGNEKLAKAIGPYKNLTIEDFSIVLADHILIKADGVETEDVAAQPGEASQPQVHTEDLSERIAPALTILKQILERAEVKRQERSEIEAHKQALELESQNAEIIALPIGPQYVTMDGDGIGNQVARAQYTDDEEKVKEISRRIDNGMHLFMTWATSYGGTIIEVGGDEGQVKVPAAALEHIEEFRSNYLKQVGATVTVGVGSTISQSVQARELGKLRGKNQVVYFDENTEKELNLRLQQEGESSPEKKLIDAGVVEPVKEQPKMGEQADEQPRPMPKYGMPAGTFEDNQKKQQEYETWLQSQKKDELSS